jgi:hypothetical protein
VLAVLLVALVWVLDTHPASPHPGRTTTTTTTARPSTRAPAGLSFTNARGCRPAGDWRSPRLDRRARALLVAAATHHRIRVSCLHAGHSWYVKGTTRLSNHSVWRAVDIDRVDGHPVSPSNPAARELALWVGRLSGFMQPSEVGSPWDFGDRPWFSDNGHQHHLHIGFAGPTRDGGR